MPQQEDRSRELQEELQMKSASEMDGIQIGVPERWSGKSRLCRSQMHQSRIRKLEQGQTAYHREASRLESLQNLAERYDGYGNSIRRVMERRDSKPGIYGVVADLIKAEKEI